ncbi:MAG: methyl-accepting chemotaxis protein [Pseudomonadota bacterium]
MRLRFVMIVIIAPMLALAVYFAMLHVSAERQRLEAATAVVMRATEQSAINDLIHELQKERGFSAGFVASQGDNFRADLAEQRRLTQAALAPAMQNTSTISSDRSDAFTMAQRSLRQLANFREDVSALRVSVPDVAGYYTGIINALMSVAYPAAGSGADQAITEQQAIRALLAAAKERAGLERAMGSTLLGGGMSPGVYSVYQQHVGAQSGLLDQITRLDDDSRVFDELTATPAFAAIQSARSTIASAVQGDDFGTLTAPAWFTLSTHWIEELRAAELALSDAVVTQASTIRNTTANRVEAAMVVAGALIVVTAAIAIASFEWMVRRIKSLTAVVYGFAKGEFDVFVPRIDGKDELSLMARAIYHFKQETLAMRRDAEALKAADEASLNAKHGKVVTLVTEGLAALAKADLTCRFDQPLDGEYDAIRNDFNAATGRLRQVLGAIAETVANLEQEAAGMNRSALDLAGRTTEQVETIRQTTTQVGALSSELETFGEDVIGAAGLAGSAREQATSSAALMRDAVAAMDRIRASSEQIGAIIAMIEDISFQTNLLALNAGVEAARAGEAGRGFAVVASEVRALAQRASDATTEIKTLVAESGAHVREGGTLVDQTGAALDEISHRIMEVDDVLSRIAAGSQAQIDGLKGLANAMGQINALTEQNLSMADDTKSSATDMASRAVELGGLIRDFKLDDSNDTRVGRAA